MKSRLAFATALALLTAPPAATPQAALPEKVSIAFNRYSDYPEILDRFRAIAGAYPDLVELRSLGRSLQGRELLVAIVTAKKTGSDRDKPAMWIDANVHGNEIQGTEAVLYTLHYLTRAYGVSKELTELLDRKALYLLPSQNPDGRAQWFARAQNSSSSRGNQRPDDDDRDGLVDEDAPDDLDGDGSITSMWQRDPFGRWKRDPVDPRIFRTVAPGETGEWTRVGSEGIDDDGDGRINEDGPGGDDMNRNWPTDWQPEYVQFGAGPYPFSAPETRAIGAFILDHPNIAGVQSYHNAGGMILRGPGAKYLEGSYPQDDVRVYDEIAKLGEQLLPYYRSMVIYRDLYTVHGGFVNWTAEGLGIFSFTNEMWNESKFFQRDGAFDDEREWVARDRLRFGLTFKDYTELDHPTLGKVLVGGPNKWDSRTTPTFLLEEECHRNFAFTMVHAGAMPELKVRRTAAARVRTGLWSVSVEIENEELIPTRSGYAAQKKIGSPDLLLCLPPAGGAVVAGGPLDRFDDKQLAAVRHEPDRLQVNRGIPGKGSRAFRFLVGAPDGSAIKFRYVAEKATDLAFDVVLQ